MLEMVAALEIYKYNASKKEGKDQGPELQCLLKVKEDLS